MPDPDDNTGVDETSGAETSGTSEPYDYATDPQFAVAPHGFERNSVTPAPADQLGVRAEYPQGYNGPAFAWHGTLSQLVAGGETIRFKVAEGFLPRRGYVKCSPVVDTVHEGLTKTLVSGDSVAVAVSGGGAAFSGTVAYGSGVATPFVTAAVSGAAVAENDDTWATVTGSGTLSGDCLVEIGVFAEQVDPHPPKQH